MRQLYFIPLLMLLTILPGLSGCGGDESAPRPDDANVMTDTGPDEPIVDRKQSYSIKTD